jgi:hypothetical protein
MSGMQRRDPRESISLEMMNNELDYFIYNGITARKDLYTESRYKELCTSPRDKDIC